VRSLLRAYEKLTILNKKRREGAQEEVILSAACVTGDVTTGTVGFEKLEEYTVMGKALEMAKQLAEAAVEYGGTRLLATDNTLRQVGEQFITRECDVIKLSDLSTAVKVHAVANLAKAGVSEVDKLVRGAQRERAFSRYRAQAQPRARVLISRPDLPPPTPPRYRRGRYTRQATSSIDTSASQRLSSSLARRPMTSSAARCVSDAGCLRTAGCT
jgi:hypothetical protein